MQTVVSGHNATDKTPMYEMPLICVSGFLFWGLGEHFLYWGFGFGVLSLAFCAEIAESLLGVGLHSKPSV